MASHSTEFPRHSDEFYQFHLSLPRNHGSEAQKRFERVDEKLKMLRPSTWPGAHCHKNARIFATRFPIDEDGEQGAGAQQAAEAEEAQESEEAEETEDGEEAEETEDVEEGEEAEEAEMVEIASPASGEDDSVGAEQGSGTEADIANPGRISLLSVRAALLLPGDSFECIRDSLGGRRQRRERASSSSFDHVDTPCTTKSSDTCVDNAAATDAETTASLEEWETVYGDTESDADTDYSNPAGLLQTHEGEKRKMRDVRRWPGIVTPWLVTPANSVATLVTEMGTEQHVVLQTVAEEVPDDASEEGPEVDTVVGKATQENAAQEGPASETGSSSPSIPVDPIEYGRLVTMHTVPGLYRFHTNTSSESLEPPETVQDFPEQDPPEQDPSEQVQECPRAEQEPSKIQQRQARSHRLARLFAKLMARLKPKHRSPYGVEC